MSKRKQQEELEGNEDSLEKEMSPTQYTTTTRNVSERSGQGTAHQIDYQVDLEAQNSEMKCKSIFEVLKKVFKTLTLESLPSCFNRKTENFATLQLQYTLYLSKYKKVGVLPIRIVSIRTTIRIGSTPTFLYFDMYLDLLALPTQHTTFLHCTYFVCLRI